MKIFLMFAFIVLLVPQTVLAARVSPVDNGTITSGVGWRLDPFGSGRMAYHRGYDIAVPAGTAIYPTQRGSVYFAGPWKGYGNLVVIEHGAGYVTLYGHNSEILVQAGDMVDTNTVIARAGSTGRSTGPHVHYEIRQLPGYAKAGQDDPEQGRKTFVQQNRGLMVEDAVPGMGGGDTESFMPAEPDD